MDRPSFTLKTTPASIPRVIMVFFSKSSSENSGEWVATQIGGTIKKIYWAQKLIHNTESHMTLKKINVFPHKKYKNRVCSLRSLRLGCYLKKKISSWIFTKQRMQLSLNMKCKFLTILPAKIFGSAQSSQPVLPIRIRLDKKFFAKNTPKSDPE